MNKVVPLAILLLFAHQAASAENSPPMHYSALALAALVAENSPLLTPYENERMARLFDGRLDFTFPANKKISVTADSVICQAHNADITSRSCELTFGAKKVALKGRRAHELYATLTEVGVPDDGAAGTIFESLSHLVCTIDPNEIKQKLGEGADCKFDSITP